MYSQTGLMLLIRKIKIARYYFVCWTYDPYFHPCNSTSIIRQYSFVEVYTTRDWYSKGPSTVNFKNLSESDISLDKSAIMKNKSSSHQSSTSHQSEDNTYSQDLLNVLGSYPLTALQGLNGFLQVGNMNRFKTSQMKMEWIHRSQIV